MKFYTVTPKPYLKLRILATLIDYSIFITVCCIYIYSFGKKTDINTWELNGGPMLIIPLFWFLYFVLTETINQATPGHDICRLKVIKTDGYKITLSDAFKRRICDPIDLGIYGIPALICIYKTDKHQRIGDILANTLVVKLSDIEEKEVIF